MFHKTIKYNFVPIYTLTAIAFLVSCQTTPPAKIETPSPAPQVAYSLIRWDAQAIQTLIVPTRDRWLVSVAVADGVDNLDNFARQHQAIAAINAGFFDPQNRQTTSFAFVDGKLAANPQHNLKLVQNPQLKPYLTQIFNRSEFRVYQCPQQIQYDITSRSQTIPKGCQILSAVGAGPQLIPQITAKEEGFLDTRRDPIGVNQPNARSAAGILPDGSVILAMVSNASGGLSLPQLQQFLKSVGAVKAIALDGGSSSSFYYRGKTFYGKVDRSGKVIQRPVKSVLVVREVTKNAAN